MPTPDEAADAALAYALWDSENTIRMKACCIQEHIARAQSVRHWLRLHGHDIAPAPHSGPGIGGRGWSRENTRTTQLLVLAVVCGWGVCKPLGADPEVYKRIWEVGMLLLMTANGWLWGYKIGRFQCADTQAVERTTSEPDPANR